MKAPVLIVGLLFSAACEQTLSTGKVGNKTHAPGPDGSCPTGLVVCGTGAFARCVDLQADPEHCGSCATVCAPGIACTAGACQQVACAAPITVSAEPLPASKPAGIHARTGTIVADVNGDGRLDLVTWWLDATLSPTSGTFEVALGEAGGGFGAARSYETPNKVGYIVAADSNSDGIDDLYVNGVYGSPPCLQIWLGNPDGRLTPRADIGDSECVNAEATGDLNGDGMVDLVSFPIAPSIGRTVFLADADGNYHTGIDVPSQRGSSGTIVFDWNGDGFPDLVALPTLAVYLNQGNGRFGDEMACGVSASILVDFNHDGYPDVATVIDRSVGVNLGLGGCQFEPMAEYVLSGPLVALAHGDLDGDGNEDLVARTGDGSVSLLRGTGDGTFHIAPLASVGMCGEDCGLLVADVTGDGRLDVIAAGGSGIISIDIFPDGGSSATLNSGTTQILQNTCP